MHPQAPRVDYPNPLKVAVEENFWRDCQPTITLIQRSYKESLKGWTNERIRRICSDMSCTLRELCAVAGVFSNSDINRWYASNKWPVYMLLTFARIESFLDQRTFGNREINPDDAAMAKLLNRSKGKTLCEVFAGEKAADQAVTGEQIERPHHD